MSNKPIWGNAHLPDIYSYRANTLTELRKGFVRPPREAGPWVYWFWFDNVIQREEITRELEEMAAVSIAGVELRCASMYGFERGSPGPWFNPEGWKRLEHRRLEYLSPEFVDVLEYTFSEAQRLGLRFSMNLGMGWPPGGRWITDEYRSKHLISSAKIVQGPTSLDLKVKSDTHVLAWTCKTERTVIPDSYLDLTTQVTTSGTLQWTVPQGKWLVGLFQTVPGGLCDKGEGPEADPASRKAMLFHLNEMFARLDPQLERFYGTTLIDIASDSWEYARGKKGRYWSNALFDAAKNVVDYNLKSRMYALLGYGPNKDGLLYDMKKIQHKAIHENYFKTIAEFTTARQLNHRPQAYGRGLERDLFVAYALADIPEIEEGVYVPEAVWVARILNKPIISCEAFTHVSIRHVNKRYDAHRGAFTARTRPQDMWKTTPALLRALSNAHFARGINRIQIHSFSYSPPAIPAPGWRMYAEIHLNRNVSWWPEMKQLSTWIARNQFVLQSGVPVSDALVYPVETNPVDGPFNVMPDQPWSAINALDAANPYLLNRLAHGMDKKSYCCPNIVLCDDIHTIQEVLDLLALIKYGKTIWCCSSVPDQWPALQNITRKNVRDLLTLLQRATEQGKIKNFCHRNWQDIVKDLQSVRWTGSGKLSFQHRRIPGAEIYLLTSWEDPFDGEVSFPHNSLRPEIWNADTGEIRILQKYSVGNGRTTISFKLKNNESRIIVFAKT